MVKSSARPPVVRPGAVAAEPATSGISCAPLLPTIPRNGNQEAFQESWKMEKLLPDRTGGRDAPPYFTARSRRATMIEAKIEAAMMMTTTNNEAVMEMSA